MPIPNVWGWLYRNFYPRNIEFSMMITDMKKWIGKNHPVLCKLMANTVVKNHCCNYLIGQWSQLCFGAGFNLPKEGLDNYLLPTSEFWHITPICQPENYAYIYIYMLFEYWSLTFFHNQISNDIDLKASLKVNHDKFTRQNQSAFQLPLEKGKQSMFYFSAQLCNLLTWGFIDYPTRAFGGGVAACLWDEDRCAVHWAPPWCSISTAKLEFFYSKPGSIITYWHSWSTLDVDHWYKGGFRCHKTDDAKLFMFIFCSSD